MAARQPQSCAHRRRGAGISGCDPLPSMIPGPAEGSISRTGPARPRMSRSDPEPRRRHIPHRTRAPGASCRATPARARSGPASLPGIDPIPWRGRARRVASHYFLQLHDPNGSPGLADLLAHGPARLSGNTVPRGSAPRGTRSETRLTLTRGILHASHPAGGFARSGMIRAASTDDQRGLRRLGRAFILGLGSHFICDTMAPPGGLDLVRRQS